MKRFYYSIVTVLILISLFLLKSIIFGDKNYNSKNKLKAENKIQFQKNQALKEQNVILEFEIKNAKDSNEHVENFARENLNLTYPNEEFIIFDNKKDEDDERE
tara:strand:+ start:54947 stop:55255 length:309 start_codon:yes stop_codon:yes gene_type:complete